jgi:hypothetical protein
MRLWQPLIVLVLCTACAATHAPEPPSCAALAEPTALKIERGNGITPPKSLHRVDPIAPANLHDRSAVARIDAVIGEDGKPRHICITRGDPLWADAAAAAVREWTFEPATLNGKPVAVLFTLTTKFTR